MLIKAAVGRPEIRAGRVAGILLEFCPNRSSTDHSGFRAIKWFGDAGPNPREVASREGSANTNRPRRCKARRKAAFGTSFLVPSACNACMAPRHLGTHGGTLPPFLQAADKELLSP